MSDRLLLYNGEVPAWLASYAGGVADLLGIPPMYRLTIEIVDAPDGDPDAAGACQVTYAYAKATIEINRDALQVPIDLPDLCDTIVHELCHVAVTWMKAGHLRAIAGLPPRDQGRAYTEQNEGEEMTVTFLSRGIIHSALIPLPEVPT